MEKVKISQSREFDEGDPDVGYEKNSAKLVKTGRNPEGKKFCSGFFFFCCGGISEDMIEIVY